MHAVLINPNDSPYDPNIFQMQPNNIRGDDTSRPFFLASETMAYSDSGGAHGCCGNNSSTFNQVHKPAETDDFKETEEFIAAEMNNLSVQERNKALEDIHCVGKELEEDPNLVEQGLQEFQQLVDVLRPTSPSYQAAEAINADYVNDRGFRLKFLRAKLYDVKTAVNQMMKFLQYKEKYFGRDKLCKEIDLSDLTEEDRAFLRSGPFFVPQHRDRSGRPIVFMMNTKISRGTGPTMVRNRNFADDLLLFWTMCSYSLNHPGSCKLLYLVESTNTFRGGTAERGKFQSAVVPESSKIMS